MGNEGLPSNLIIIDETLLDLFPGLYEIEKLSGGYFIAVDCKGKDHIITPEIAKELNLVDDSTPQDTKSTPSLEP